MKRKSEPEEKFCAYCENGSRVDITREDGQVLCRLKGIVAGNFSCGKFKYDLLKREHKRMPRIPKAEYIDINDTGK